ncbi:MAG TPA: MMPL family transporter [Thermoleophilaceae bacterium]|nr:MMPL family transporter [Thermoleophilaceae bacterium]
MLERVADLTWKRPKAVLAAVFAFVVVAGVFGHDVERHLKAAGFTDSASESERATGQLREELGYDPTPGIVLLVRARDHGRLDVRSPAFRREVDRLARELDRTRHVGRVVNPLRDRREGRALIARDGRSLVLSGHLSTQDIEDEGGDAAEEAKRRLTPSTLDVRMGGFAPSFNEVNDQTRKDLTKAELIAFPILAVLLLVVFRGVVAAAIPLVIGVFSILGAFLMLRLMSGIVDTSLFALNIATALSLGLAVDYALLMVSRYREEIDVGGATREAHHKMVMTAGRTALFSGFTVAVAMASLVLFPQRFLYSVGVAGAVVGLVSAVIAVLVVPAALALLGTRVNALSVRSGPAVSDDSGGWYRLAWGVMKRPALVALASGALLLAAAAPLLSTVLTGPSAEAVPPGQPSYGANEAIEAAYPRSVSEPITVAVGGKQTPRQLAALSRRIRGLEGIADGTPFARAGPGLAYATFGPDRPALDAGPQDAVDRIRELRPTGGGDVLVTGNTARFMDEKSSLLDHLPLVAAVVALSTFVLLFMLTGSVVIPIKTLLMNTLTLAATLGLLVLAFQEGVLDTPMDYIGPAAVEVTSLVFLFAVIFGLATDYAVLVVARIKEQHDLGVPNEEAVAVGIGRTGRVITAAAVMIAVVFLAFGVSSVFFMKQIAVGQAVGVLLDATIVRALLVPSLMALLGEWNWWAPGPLRRLQARFGFQEA